jgi:DNA-binding transcriptional regulator YhcF (GntR family)
VNRQRVLFLPPIQLDRASDEALHQQIARQLREAIRRAPAAGRRLPSTRMLAGIVDVSRNTVLAAYETLIAEGLLDPQRGWGMRIAAGGTTGVRAFDLRRILREAHYPRRVVALQDQDGQLLALNVPDSAD